MKPHAEWVERARELAAEWKLRLGDPYALGAGGVVFRARRADGSRAVLKVIHPHREAEHEADALELWAGDGAVRLLERDEEGLALLLERCEPGTFLSDVGAGAALDVLVGLLPRLWKDAGPPFRSLTDEAAWWSESLRDSDDGELRDAAVAALAALATTQGEQVLVHQDLHGENVLAARREPWLTIDPKPLVGEREFALAPIIRGPELGPAREDVLHRLDFLSSRLGLDRERARLWALAQSVAWADGSRQSQHLRTARWLLEAD